MSEDDLFKKAVQDVSPIKRKDTVDIYSQKPKPKPIAKKLIEDEKKVLRDALSDNFESIDYFLARDELFYLKKGIPQRLSKSSEMVHGLSKIP